MLGDKANGLERGSGQPCPVFFSDGGAAEHGHFGLFTLSEITGSVR